MMKCSNCGADLEDGVLFCRECGSKVHAMKKRFCRECGAELTRGANFCSACGAPADFARRVNSEETVTEPKDSSIYSSRFKKTAGSENFSAFSDNVFKTKFPNKKHHPKNSSIFGTLVGTIAGFFVLLVLCISFLGNGSSSNPKPDVDSTHASDANNNTIQKGSEYAYMTGEWDVYIATALSDSLIQIENWRKGFSSDKSVKHDYDLGTFKINDPENEFQWIDEEHTTFSIKITDENKSSFKKGNTATFTINITSENENKGSDYNEAIASYAYVNDDWHMYRAIPLTPTLIKIEMWQRTFSMDISPYLFGRDVCVIDSENTSTDFEWTDDDHTSFTITMKDPENKSYWKEETFVAFKLENEKYKYPDIISYLKKATVSELDSRPQKNGFDSATNDLYYFSQFSVEVPPYWTNEKTLKEGTQRYAEKDGKVAMLNIYADYDIDESYPVTFDGLMSDLDNMMNLVKTTVFSEVTGYEVVDTGYVKGIMFTGHSPNFQGSGLDLSGKWFTFASENDRFWCNFILEQTENTDYLYDDDYMKILYSIRPVNDEAKETTAPAKPDETTVIEVETTTAEAESSTAQTESSATETAAVKQEITMPVMSGTSIDTAVGKANEFGLRELYDENFGHGTRCKSLSDSAGGLTIDIIYSSSSKEILSGSIVTFNKLSTSSSQKKFIKGMASVLCPTEDIATVTSWVNSNVGKSTETEISGEIYELDLGSVGNLLYSAGERNWEDWDSAQQ